MINKTLKIALVFLITFTTINLVQANNKDLPKKFIENLADKMITNVITSNSDDKVDAFRRLFIENIDLNAISRFVLGSHWRRLDDAKKEEFVRSFTEATVLTWSSRFDEYKGEKIVFHNSTPAPTANQFFVKSLVDFAENNDVEVVWRLQQSGNNFKIIDIIVEGVSMAMTYRNEYNSIIQNSGKGIDGLIASLNSKIDEYNK